MGTAYILVAHQGFDLPNGDCLTSHKCSRSKGVEEEEEEKIKKLERKKKDQEASPAPKSERELVYESLCQIFH